MLGLNFRENSDFPFLLFGIQIPYSKIFSYITFLFVNHFQKFCCNSPCNPNAHGGQSYKWLVHYGKTCLKDTIPSAPLSLRSFLLPFQVLALQTNIKVLQALPDTPPTCLFFFVVYVSSWSVIWAYKTFSFHVTICRIPCPLLCR